MESERWTVERAVKWHRQQPWLCGFNFVPSYAVNTTELWQADSFDPATIDRELGIAAGAGFNACRIFLQWLVWQHDPDGTKLRIEQFLGFAEKHAISATFCLFDDCAFSKKAPFPGKQDEPLPGRMATSWTASPGHARVNDPSTWGDLEKYVKDIVGSFGRDRRVVIWDFYNEPGNEGQGDKSLPLLESTFRWAREVAPQQPLTSSVWHSHASPTPLNEAMLKHSDIISFHLYAPIEETRNCITLMKQHGRPVICTEWMARLLNIRMQTHLPMFKLEEVGCYCWGLVNGRMQTNFPWDALKPQWTDGEWFHDLFHPDGRPYKVSEIETIQKTVCAST